MIYRQALWDDQKSGSFNSGPGSHDPSVVAPYVEAALQFIEKLGYKPNVVDLGCGDFNVGQQIRPFCNCYIACDVVPDLIGHNKIKYAALGVDFTCLDLAKDVLPEGDMAFLRQVLQHLSNDLIQQVLPKLAKYKYVVVSEHLPLEPAFTPNVDKPLGAGVRLVSGSGVVLTAAPFHLAVRSEQVICTVKESDGLIQTTVYEMA